MLWTVLSIIFAGLSLALAVYLGITNKKRDEKQDIEKDTASFTTVSVQLESLKEVTKDGFRDIKSELSTIKDDAKEVRERLIKAEGVIHSLESRVEKLETQ